jgi:glycosyltransferase involved in cell wall biosynthesis
MAEKKLAIVVPVKNRQAYLDVFLEAIPAYLEKVNGLHDFKIFVAEQVDEVPFNLSLSRNIGARFALDEDRFDYLIFHDVDLIPVENVDYGYREKNVCWFMKAGTCKIHKQALLDANGYNPSIWGWCSEDYEFYSRVCDFGHQMETWHQIPESRNAVIVDLDMNPQSRDECAAHSRWYFGHDGNGPRYISYNWTDHIRPREQVPKDGWRMKNWHFERLSDRHREIIDFLVSMPRAMKQKYANLYGLNWVNKDKVRVLSNSDRLCHLQYQWFEAVD